MKQQTLYTQDLDFSFDEVLVLNGISIEITAGSVTALVGPNGCGKSTLLSTLARLIKPNTGSVILNGREIASQRTRDVARSLGFLPQNPVLPESTTVFELVSRGRYPHQPAFGGFTDIDFKAIDIAMEMTGTIDLSTRPVDSLSGGQRQRCWIALVLAQETPIILLDEPTSFLDLRYQLDILRLLCRLAKHHGKTIIIALHDLNLAASHADRMVFMREGTVYVNGTTKDVFTSANIEAVFDVPVVITSHPETGDSIFLPKKAKL